MKRTFFIFLTLIFASCSGPEPDEFEYSVEILNESNSQLVLEIYDARSLLIDEFFISPNQRGNEFSYIDENFSGFVGDSVIFKFSNSRGYICTFLRDSEGLCFLSKQIFGNDDSFIDSGNNSFMFVISQEDFDNAFDLPQ